MTSILFKTIVGIIITTVIYQTLSTHSKELALLLVIAVCCMAFTMAVSYLKPIIEFIEQLKTFSGINNEMVSVLLKSVGISILCEVTCMICKDVGNAALAKCVQLLSVFVMLWIALPLFNELISLLEEVLVSV